MKKTILPLLILLTLLLAACGEQSTATNPPASTPTQSQPTPTPMPAGHHKLGDTVKIFFAWNITITKVEAKDTNSLNGVEQIPSQPDYKFVILTLSVENISDFEQTFNSNNFTMKDTAHFQTKPGPVLSGDVKAPPDGTIAAKDTNAGQITFEMPKTEKQFTLQYQMEEANANTPGDSLFTWDITVP